MVFRELIGMIGMIRMIGMSRMIGMIPIKRLYQGSQCPFNLYVHFLVAWVQRS